MWNAKSSPWIPSVSLAALATCLALAAGCQPLDNRAASALLSAYGDRCVSKGAWTDSAIAQSEAFQSVIKDLKEKDACKPFASQLTKIEGFSGSIKEYIDDVKYKSYLSQQSMMADLIPVSHHLLPAGGLAEAAQKILLESAFEKTTAIKKAEAEYETTRKELYGNRFRDNAAGFVDKVQGMMTNLPALQECLRQSPLAAAQLSTQMLGLVGDASTPANGAAMNSIAQLMSMALSFESETAKINRAEYEAQKNQMPEGLSCALESMTELYCQAEDARTLLELQTDSYRKQATTGGRLRPDSVWYGMHLLTRDLPVIVQTLRKIRAGAPPNDGFDAARQNEVWTKVQTLDATARDIEGSLAKAETSYALAVNDPEVQQANLIQLIKDLAAMLDASQPFATLISGDQRILACRVALGFTNPCPKIDEVNHKNSEMYIRATPEIMGTSIAAIRANWLAIKERASRGVEIELAQQITIDPQMSLVAMLKGTANTPSAADALREVHDFLGEYAKLMATHPPDTEEKQNEDARVLAQVRDTQDRIKRVVDALTRDALDPDGNKYKSEEDQAKAKVAVIYSQFRLRIGIQFLPERIKQFAEWDLIQRRALGQFPEEAAEIISQMGGEVAERVANNSLDIERIKLDLDQAQSLTQRNIQRFLNYFNQGVTQNVFQDATETLLDAAENSNEPYLGSTARNRNVLAKLCILSAIAYEGRNSAFRLNTVDYSSSDVLSTGPGDYLENCKDAILSSAFASPKEEFNIFNTYGAPLTIAYRDVYKTVSGQEKFLGQGDSVRKGKENDLHDQIFNAVVWGKPSREEMKYTRKVCLFHRFLRAGRIMTALPTLDQQTQFTLAKRDLVESKEQEKSETLKEAEDALKPQEKKSGQAEEKQD